MVELFRALNNAAVPQELAFPKAEYAERVAKVRKAMEAEGIGVLLVQYAPNFCYLSGYQTPLANWYGCLVLPLEGELIAHLPMTEVPNLMIHGWDNENIYTLPGYMNIEAAIELGRILQQRGLADKTIGVEERLPGWSAYTAMQLREQLPKARIRDGSDLVLGLRAVKSPGELAHIRRAARFTDIGMQAGLDSVASGKTDNDVISAAYAAMVRAGSEYLSIQPLVYTSHVTGMLHVAAKRRPIKAGETVIIELAGVCQRYAAPLVRTAIVGLPSDPIKRMVDYSVATLALIAENLRPGRTLAEVTRAVTQRLQSISPVPQVRRTAPGYGYSVGIGFPPDWVEHSLFIDEGYQRPVEEGMVFHTPFGVRVPGKVGISFSQCWTVTATGCEALSKLKPDLTIVSP
jgi:Xaa-Pro dipeptidase